jgi:rhodanese-related sulfurtransferase
MKTKRQEVDRDILHLEPEELRDLMARKDHLQIIDVREYPEYAVGHIASSRLVPLGALEARAHEFDAKGPVVCVCHSGKRSAQGASKLIKLGFEEVGQLDGGIQAWKASGLPLAKAVRAPWSLQRQVRLSLGLFVLTGLALSLRWPSAILVTWIIGVGMVFTSVVDWCGMALLLAKAPWNKDHTAFCAQPACNKLD